MKQYLDIVKHVLENGKEKRPVRKNEQTGGWEPVDGGVMTLACPNVLFSHDMSEGFPLLTTKKMAWKSIRVELEGFIKGVTDKRWFQERGCKIWDEWCNPELVQDHPYMRDFQYDETMSRESMEKEYNERKKAAQKEINDLGPIYGSQWRRFNQNYDSSTPISPDHTGYMSQPTYYSRNGQDYNVTDQLANIVNTLQNNPMDRRMVCSAWNPNQIHMMALPPCHTQWGCTVIGDELNLFWAQRSCDLMLGVPFNIASYALLLSLLAEVGGFKRGNLSGMLVDCHIYENQLDAAREQVTREPQPLPSVGILRHMDMKPFDIFNWSYDDVHITNYNPLEKIDFGKVTV